MQATSDLGVTPSRETVANLFKNCMEFSMSSRLFHHRTQNLHNMGVNAQIFASKSKDANAVLGVLVREISTLASNTSAALKKISVGCEDLAKNAIVTTRTAHHLQIFQRAWDAGLDSRSSDLLLSAFSRNKEEMSQSLLEIKFKLIEHQLTLRELQDATLHIPVLICLININVAKFEGFSIQFSDITKELGEFKADILSSTESMSLGISEAIAIIEEAENTDEDLLEVA